MSRFGRPAAWLPLACLSLAFALSPAASAQLLQGALDGNVTDSTGAAIPGATITATNQETGLVRTAESNEAGVFNLPTMPSGSYIVEVTFEGFQSARRTGVQVQPNAVTRVDLSLEVGQVTETVEVAATAADVADRPRRGAPRGHRDHAEERAGAAGP